MGSFDGFIGQRGVEGTPHGVSGTPAGAY